MNDLLAALFDRCMAGAEAGPLGEWRRFLLAGVGGDVLELGAGTGANLPHYSPAVERLVVTEPSAPMRRRLESKANNSGRTVEVAPHPAEQLDFPDSSFDAVISTLVLCSVDDQAQALAEARRVLRPGGRLVFLEHVAAPPNTSLRLLQRLMDPIWCRLAGNCHLLRPTGDNIAAAGFEMVQLNETLMPSSLPWVRPTVRGHAIRSG
jgi:ubiquinone/menaquinone biosynthesis C-methylase UbiE